LLDKINIFRFKTKIRRQKIKLIDERQNIFQLVLTLTELISKPKTLNLKFKNRIISCIRYLK